MKSVPDYARVDRPIYIELRNELRRTCNGMSYDFHSVWDLMIDRMNERHALVAKGRRKHELSLEQAVADMQKEVIKARVSREKERADASTA